MAEPESIILEHLKAIRVEMSEMRGDIRRLDEKVDDLNVGQQSLQGVLMGLGHYIHAIDHRVEALEEKIGGQT